MEGDEDYEAAEEEDAVFTYRFSTASSVYTEVEKILSTMPQWKKTKGTRFDLLLAERWEVSYARLGLVPGLRQRVNHMRGTKNITVKALMVKSLRGHRARLEVEGKDLPVEIIPPTFLLVPGNDLGCERIGLGQCIEASGSPLPIWICKSTTGAHGKDIIISESIDEILEHIDGVAEGGIEESPSGLADDASGDTAAASSHHLEAAASGDKRLPLAGAAAAKRKRPPAWLVQRYISSPMLYHGRKFDIRALVCVLDSGEVYWYDKWILRMCSREYSLDDLADKIVHISNHCVQTDSESYGVHEDGNELFTDDLERYLVSHHGEEAGKEILQHVVRQMQDAVVQTLASIDEVFSAENKYSSFQLLGYDFMIDSWHRVWLLECNGSPACATRMIEDFARDLTECAVVVMGSGKGSGEFGPTSGSKRLQQRQQQVGGFRQIEDMSETMKK